MTAYRRWAVFSLPLNLVVSLFWLAGLGCSGPKDNRALFADERESTAPASGAGGSSAGWAGTDSGVGANLSRGGVTNSEAGSSAGIASGGLGGTAGSSGVGATGGAIDVTTAGSGGGQPKAIESCDMLDGATTNEQNGHCYRINSEQLTFVAAGAACQATAGHLVTLTDEAEDDFVRGLLDTAHWIGAWDGRADRTPGTAPFVWTDGEPWDYSNWESGQPNAVATNCANESSGAHCYEHCAYQTTGSWNDRACFHTIASICEWEPVAK
jgi:hypothetical protein